MKVLLTGGSRGIGRAIAEELLIAGHEVLIIAQNKSNLQASVAQFKNKFGSEPLSFCCDVSKKQELDELREFVVKAQFNPDVLVLNAGIFLEGDLSSADEEAFRRTLDVNLMAIYYMVQLFLNDLRKSRKGRIVLMGSTAAYEQYPLGPLYGVAKWALRGYAQNLRHELMSEGIGVTFLAPGGTLTDLWAGEDIASDRLLEPRDIGKIVVCLLDLSPQAVVEELIIRPMLGDIHE